MRVAYVDTSCVVALALDEASSGPVRDALLTADLVVSSNLLEAELRSALAREGVSERLDPTLRRIAWVYPDRRLTREFEVVLDKGFVRGADLWHLACALFVRDSVGVLEFLTLDHRQRSVAAALGFE
jgi:hypothetical protein